MNRGDGAVSPGLSSGTTEWKRTAVLTLSKQARDRHKMPPFRDQWVSRSQANGDAALSSSMPAIRKAMVMKVLWRRYPPAFRCAACRRLLSPSITALVILVECKRRLPLERFRLTAGKI